MMLYPYTTAHYKCNRHGFWVAESSMLKGCAGQGATRDMAIEELEANEFEWLRTAREFNIPIPPQDCNEE